MRDQAIGRKILKVPPLRRDRGPSVAPRPVAIHVDATNPHGSVDMYGDLLAKAATMQVRAVSRNSSPSSLWLFKRQLRPSHHRSIRSPATFDATTAAGILVFALGMTGMIEQSAMYRKSRP